jgi:hypothetical protein
MIAVPHHSLVWKVENWIVPIKRSTGTTFASNPTPRVVLFTAYFMRLPEPDQHAILLPGGWSKHM